MTSITVEEEVRYMLATCKYQQHFKNYKEMFIALVQCYNQIHPIDVPSAAINPKISKPQVRY